MSDKRKRRLQAMRKLEERQNCLLALRDARSGQHAHYGWLPASAVFNVVKTGEHASLDGVQEALEYLADKGYVHFREDRTDFSDEPVVRYRISAHGQDLLDGLIDNDPGVTSH